MFNYHDIQEGDLATTLHLVKDTFDLFQKPDYTAEGVQSFYDFISEDHIKQALRTHKLHLYGCFHNQILVGILGIRQPHHICLLFVDQAYHRQGIAAQLVANWKQTLKPGATITVNSSPYAVPAYEKMGFSSTSASQTIDGITFVPMSCLLD
ncbi:GNAT family N-acetyltransferase [Vagococcus sp. BWB3-3]|uniref:GNAT family N-acetyltransferase n=1 Tax=Vagococcus allomyrinae TaxID=2794353 RepID=A0A940P6H0_9ENTE|nr:GNAT family N-acetyltransferase [Vagococcus allomyrinae]MBP1040636.1 GNAT family N-acetyltransferase [Vagococcus allomyrinae]